MKDDDNFHNCVRPERDNSFYYRKRGEGGGHKGIIVIIISENVDNYGRPLIMGFPQNFGTQPLH